MSFDDLFDDREPGTRSGELLHRMQPLEDHEYPVMELMRNTNTVVPHLKRNIRFLLTICDRHLRLCISIEFDGIRDEVPEH